MVEYIDINGAKLAYKLAGPDGAPLIITLHGGRGFGSHDSDFKAYSLLANNYRILSFDFRGHGQSSQTKPYSFKQIVEDIESLRKQLAGDNRCIIIGGSFGGFLAQQYAITYPAHISHLVLRGTAPSHDHEEDAVRILEQRLHKAPGLTTEMLRGKIFGAFENDLEFRLVMWAAAPLYSESFNANSALQANIRTVYNAESHNDLYAIPEKLFDYREQLPNVTAKTLVIVGEKDWICPPAQSRYIAARIPGARLEIIPDANHSVHHEKNEIVIQLIRGHLEA